MKLIEGDALEFNLFTTAFLLRSTYELRKIDGSLSLAFSRREPAVYKSFEFSMNIDWYSTSSLHVDFLFAYQLFLDTTERKISFLRSSEHLRDARGSEEVKKQNFMRNVTREVEMFH